MPIPFILYNQIIYIFKVVPCFVYYIFLYSTIRSHDINILKDKKKNKNHHMFWFDEQKPLHVFVFFSSERGIRFITTLHYLYTPAYANLC